MSRRLCTFSIGPYACALDVSLVQAVLRPGRCTPVPCAPEGVVGLLSLRGRIVTAFDLGPRLGLAQRPTPDAPFGILLASESADLCLLVDGLGEVGEAVPNRLEPVPTNIDERVRSMVEAAYRGPRNLFLVLSEEAIKP